MTHIQNYVPDIIKNINVRAFNLMSRTNKIRHKIARNLQI